MTPDPYKENQMKDQPKKLTANDIIPVPPEKWAKYPVRRIKIPGIPSPREQAGLFFRTFDHSVIGAIVEDGVDHDFAGVVFAKMPDGTYPAVDLPVPGSYTPTPEASVDNLKIRIAKFWNLGGSSPVGADRLREENWSAVMKDLSEGSGLTPTEMSQRVDDTIQKQFESKGRYIYEANKRKTNGHS